MKKFFLWEGSYSHHLIEKCRPKNLGNSPSAYLKYLIAASLFLTTCRSFAFRPIGHVLLKNEIVAGLPDGNVFKEAMKKHPQIAAWGAVGPDLGYNVDLSKLGRQGWMNRMKNTMQVADISHYNRVGDFVMNMIEEVEKNHDERFAAFVGGWITHIAGDFGAHSIYVAPEAGYYIADESGHDLHGELERYADAYLYKEYGSKYCLSGWNSNLDYYWEDFFGIPAVYYGKKDKNNAKLLLEKMLCPVQTTFKKIYWNTYKADTCFSFTKLALTYNRAVGVGVPSALGFGQFDMGTVVFQLELNGRKKRIEEAFEKAKEYAHRYLTASTTKRDPNLFSNRWNLDIGPNDTATYIVCITPEKGRIAKSKNDVFVQFTDKQGKKSPKILLTNKISKLKFAFKESQVFYYHVNMGGTYGEINCWNVSNIAEATLYSRPRHRLFHNNVLRVKEVTLSHTGKELARLEKPEKCRLRLDKKHNLKLIVGKSNKQ